MWLVIVPVVLVAVIVQFISRHYRQSLSLTNHVTYSDGKWQRPLGECLELVNLKHANDQLFLVSEVLVLTSKTKLEESVLKTIFAALGEKHPILKARYYVEHDKDYFREMDTFSVPFYTSQDTDWKHVFEQQMTSPYDKERGPLWRVVFLPNARDPRYEDEDYPHQCVLVFGFQHSIMDGTSKLLLIRDILKMIGEMIVSGEISRGEENIHLSIPCPFEMRHPQFLGYTTQGAIGVILYALTTLNPAVKIMRNSFSHNTWIDKFGAEIDRDPHCDIKTSIIPMEFDSNTTQKLRMSSRQHQITLQAVFQTVASICFAEMLQDGHLINGVIDVGSIVSVSLRRHFPKYMADQGYEVAIASLFVNMRIDSEWKSKFWVLTRDCYASLHGNLQQEAIYRLKVIQFMNFLSDMFGIFWCKNPKKTARSNAHMSFANVGDCNYLNNIHEAVKVRSGYMATGEHLMGQIFHHSIITVGGRLQWGLVYYTNITKQSVAEDLARRIQNTLLDIVA